LDVFRRSGFEFVDVPTVPLAERRQDPATSNKGFADEACDAMDPPSPHRAESEHEAPEGGGGRGEGSAPAFAAPCGPSSLRLAAVPLSRNTILGVDDVLELVAKLREGAVKPDELRPSRIRAMLAR